MVKSGGSSLGLPPVPTLAAGVFSPSLFAARIDARPGPLTCHTPKPYVQCGYPIRWEFSLPYLLPWGEGSFLDEDFKSVSPLHSAADDMIKTF